MKIWKVVLILCLLIISIFLLYLLVTAFLSRGEANKINSSLGIATCESIPAYTYETALIFNPSDAQTSYIRSRCFQELAIKEHDEQYCQYVIARKSLFFDGSAYSSERCLEAVRKTQALDQSNKIVAEQIHRINKLEVVNGNDGIYEVKVITEGSQKGSYNLSLALYDQNGLLINQLHQEILRLGTHSETYTRAVSPRNELIQDFGQQYYESAVDRPMILRAELELLTDSYTMEQFKIPPISDAAKKSRAEQIIRL